MIRSVSIRVVAIVWLVVIVALQVLLESLRGLPGMFSVIVTFLVCSEAIALVSVALVWGACHHPRPVFQLVCSLFFQVAVLCVAAIEWFRQARIDDVVAVIMVGVIVFLGATIQAWVFRLILLAARGRLQPPELYVREAPHPLRKQATVLGWIYLITAMLAVAAWLAMTIASVRDAMEAGISTAVFLVAVPFASIFPALFVLLWCWIVLAEGDFTARKWTGWLVAVGIVASCTIFFGNPVLFAWHRGRIQADESKTFLFAAPLVFSAGMATLVGGLILIRRQGIRYLR